MLGVCCRFAVYLAALLLGLSSDTSQAQGPTVFAAPRFPAADFEPRLHDRPVDPAAPLRVLTVEERVGVARVNELVRVPVFFHDGEADDFDALAIFERGDTAKAKPLIWQADDLRYNKDGKLTRAHLYFLTGLEPWQRKQYVLTRGPKTAAKNLLTIARNGDQATLQGEDLQATFQVAGPAAGKLLKLQTKLGPVDLGPGGMAPKFTLQRQASDLKVTHSAPISYDLPDTFEVRQVGLGAGPLFSKFSVTIGPKGLKDNVQFTYLVPRHGNVLIQSERVFPSEEDTADTIAVDKHELLSGMLKLGSAGEQKLLALPGGLRRVTRSVHPFTYSALVNEAAKLSLVAIPSVITGGGGVKLSEDGLVTIPGTALMKRQGGSDSHTLRQFWGEVRLVFSNHVGIEELWSANRAHFQPLTAIVDEPTLTDEDFYAALPAISDRFFEIKYWGRGWMQTAAMHYLHGEKDKATLDKLLAKQPGAKELDVEFWQPAWAKESDTPPPVKPGNKPDVGRVDPYNISYSNSVIVPFAKYLAPSEKMDQVALAIAKASRKINARVEKYGFPYLNCFATAFNMQIGSFHTGIYAGKKLNDLELARYYRDCARSQSTLCIYGHGQRTYPGNIVGGQDQSDLLYESVSDYHLRAIEVFCNEDLWLHPAAMGRYFDCVDVTADIYHRSPPGGKERRSWLRANFFRGQSHDHRWESWTCAPFMGMFAHADNRGRVGLTEGVYWLNDVSKTPINWPELMWFTHAAIMLKQGLADYQPDPAPALPKNVTTKASDQGNTVKWEAVPGAVEYRVYRAEKMGGPWTFLNSPYIKEPSKLQISGTTATDPDGKPGQVYWVTALDAKQQESRWFPEEPRPGSGVKTK
jgi:hypothetical protein